MVMAKNERFPGGFYSNAVEMMGESEGSGSSGRADAEITASEDSNAPSRKCISLNSNYSTGFDVPTQVLSLSKISPSENKDLIHRLQMELEQIRILQKKVQLHRINGVTVPTSSDILSSSYGQNGLHVENFKKTSVLPPGPGKKVNPPGNKKGNGSHRGTSGRFESAPPPSSSSTASVIVMKQCDTLLKRLMSHQHAWVFKAPVDVVKLNIPDYLTIIKHPMDLGTVKTKLASKAYSTPLEFLADVRLTFSNAMTYNPPGNDVHVMADTLSKLFEARWKAIEKKLPKGEVHHLPEKSGPREDFGTAEPMLPSKKRKLTSVPQEVIPVPAKHIMSDKEKQNIGRELESLLGDMPLHIIDFLREHSSGGKDCGEDEIEIDIDDLSNDTLFKLRKLLDEYMLEKQKDNRRSEPCEIGVLVYSPSIKLKLESGLSNSSMPPCRGSDPIDEDVDIGENELPVSSYPPVEIEKDSALRNDSDSSNSSGSASDSEKLSSQVRVNKVPEASGTDAQFEEKTIGEDALERNQSISGLDQVELTSQYKPSSVESDFNQDGEDSAATDPQKRYRAALLKNRFADTILRAREKTLTQSQGEKGDPEKLRREREELDLQRRREKARLQAEAKAAEDARRQAEAEAAAEARQKRELAREAARQALLQMEKTVYINENSRFLEDLEMLRKVPADQLPSSVDETSPDRSQDELGSFKFGSNPLEQLGLYMKDDEEDEEVEPPVPNSVNDVEEGEID